MFNLPPVGWKHNTFLNEKPCAGSTVTIPPAIIPVFQSFCTDFTGNKSASTWIKCSKIFQHVLYMPSTLTHYLFMHHTYCGSQTRSEKCKFNEPCHFWRKCIFFSSLSYMWKMWRTFWFYTFIEEPMYGAGFFLVCVYIYAK